MIRLYIFHKLKENPSIGRTNLERKVNGQRTSTFFCVYRVSQLQLAK